MRGNASAALTQMRIISIASGATCQRKYTSGHHSSTVVGKNHPTAAVAHGHGSQHAQMRPPAPSLRKSSQHTAKDKANERIAVMHPPSIPMAEIVESSEHWDHSSPNGPLVAAAGASTDYVASSEDDVSIPCTMHVTCAKTMEKDDDDLMDLVASRLFLPLLMIHRRQPTTR
jgi:hypothetical protein